MDIEALQRELARFATEREWERFHTPKNLATALAVEAAELLEPFQWLTGEESRALVHDETGMARVREELADVLIYLVRLAGVLGVDLDQAVREKIARNAERYPVEVARGNAVKYDRREP